MGLDTDGEEASIVDGVEPGEACSIHVLSLQWFRSGPANACLPNACSFFIFPRIAFFPFEVPEPHPFSLVQNDFHASFSLTVKFPCLCGPPVGALLNWIFSCEPGLRQFDPGSSQKDLEGTGIFLPNIRNRSRFQVRFPVLCEFCLSV